VLNAQTPNGNLHPMRLTALTVEKSAPAIIGIGLAVASSCIASSLKVRIAQELANSVVTLLTIETGFLTATLALMLTMPTNVAFQQIKSAGYWKEVIGYQWHGISAGVIASLLSLCVIILCKSVEEFYQQAFFYIWVASVGWALVAFLRAGLILKRLLL